ncbi:global transactivator [Pyricularia oryzae]|nr:global transactivator [Pyricularia oryzae]
MEDWNNTDLIKLYRDVETLQEAIKTGSSIAKAAALEAVREDVKRVSQHPYVHAASREEPSFLPPNALGPARELYREVSVLQALHADADGDNSDAKLQAKERLRQKANALTRALDTEYLPPRYDVPNESLPIFGKSKIHGKNNDTEGDEIEKVAPSGALKAPHQQIPVGQRDVLPSINTNTNTVSPAIARLIAKTKAKVEEILKHPTPAVTPVTAHIINLLVAGPGLSGAGPHSQATHVDSDSDSASEANDGDEDSDDSEDLVDDATFGKYEEQVVQFLNTLPPVIERKHTSTFYGDVPGLQEGIEPFEHQKVAAAFAVDTLSSDSIFQGGLIADPPGLGKTLSALMAVSETRSPGAGPCVVVAPRSCCDQWMREGKRFFGDHLKMIMLTGEPLSPLQLHKYDVIVTAYSTIVAEARQYKKYINALKGYKGRRGERPPKRPVLTLTSEVLEQEGAKRFGRMLILDEAHTIKNTRTISFNAIARFRERFEACLMLTATPLHNTWVDVFALACLLRGHDIRSLTDFRSVFTDPSDKRTRKTARVPQGHHMDRIVRFMDAFTLRRPISVIHYKLTPFELEVISIRLSPEDLRNSDEEFNKFKTAMGAKNSGNGQADASSANTTATIPTRNAKGVGLDNLIRAVQHASHPMLIEVNDQDQQVSAETKEDEVVDLDDENQRHVDEWFSRLSVDKNWRSARVDIIIDLVHKHIDVRPDDAILIMDESVYFLDILRVALEKSCEPFPCYALDGRLAPVERERVIRNFTDATGPRVMFVSRGVGGQGLNLQAANVVIQCNVWWKQSWEEHAWGRVHRPGQTRPVFVYQIEARCQVDAYKKERRDAKNETNSMIMERITREDIDELPDMEPCY